MTIGYAKRKAATEYSVAAFLLIINSYLNPNKFKANFLSKIVSNKLQNRILFVCSRNRLRSPTAEQIFSSYENLQVTSAGLSPDAEEVITAEIVEWADLIFVMEKSHRAKLKNRFSSSLRGKRVICLDIPDDFDYMQPELVALLQTKVSPFLLTN